MSQSRTFPLGRIKNHDERARAYAFRAQPQRTLRDVEHTINIPVLEQRVGSCVLNTTTELQATEPFLVGLVGSYRSARLAQLNEDYAEADYRTTTRQDPYDGAWEPDDTGTDATSAAKVLRSQARSSGFTHCFSITAFLTALQDSAVCFGSPWLESQDEPNKDGVVTYEGKERGGHETLAFKFDAAKSLVWFRNHWTADWGRDGCYAMTVTDTARALANQGDATVILPPTAPTPTPSPVDADANLVAAMTPWRKSVISRITKAGKAASAFDVWRSAKGL